MKLAIIVDSSCGLTKKQAENKGLYYLPLFLTIDNKEYEDGVEIDQKTFPKLVTLKSEVKTSASSPKAILDLYEKLSKEYDQVIVYPISKHLSSQYSNLKTFTKKYKNINIINSYALSGFVIGEVEYIREMNEKEIPIEKIIEEINKRSKKMIGFLVPKNMD
jgi:DegV family protein with EDD domain